MTEPGQPSASPGGQQVCTGLPPDPQRPERLARELCTLDSSKEQLLEEEKLVGVKLQDVKRRLCSLCGAQGPAAVPEGLFLRSQEAATAV